MKSPFVGIVKFDMPSTTPIVDSSDPPQRIWTSRRGQLAIVVLLVALGVVLRVANLDGVAFRSPDERNYTAEANTLLQQGTAGFPLLMDEHSKNPDLPGPARAGYLLLLARTMQLTGHRDETAGAELSCAASIVSLLLLVLIAWRYFTPTVAMAAVMLYAVSPMALMTARRAWEESVVEALALAMIYIACEITAGSRHWGWFLLFALLGGFSIAVKEVATASYALCFVWILIVLWLLQEKRYAILFAALCAAASATAVAWLAHLLGGFTAFVQQYTLTAHFLAGSQYSIAFEDGEPWRLLQGLWIVSATASVFALAGLAVALNWRSAFTVRRKIALALALFTTAFMLLAVTQPHHLNLRYVCVIFAPFYLLAGVGVNSALQLSRRHLAETESRPLAMILIAALICGSGLDYYRFSTHFTAPEMQDLSIRMVLSAGGVDEPTP
jgi:4-amino-4-deoxy-L-arabinose transferase-like glycosyltransferase